jgi:hypothetical protein
MGLNARKVEQPVPRPLLLEQRIDGMPGEVRESYSRTLGPGTHSEVNAAGDLLMDLLGAKPKEIAVRTIETGSEKYRGMYKPPCPHCGYLLDGVYHISD